MKELEWKDAQGNPLTQEEVAALIVKGARSCLDSLKRLGIEHIDDQLRQYKEKE